MVNTGKYIETVKVFGETFDLYKSPRKNKQRMAVSRKRDLVVHYGDPKMKEFPGTARGDNYCSRSLGLGRRYKILNDVTSPNFWSRWDLWHCNMDKSLKRRPSLAKKK